MPKVLTFEVPEDEYHTLKATLETFHEEMCKSRAIMQKDQEKIDRLREETRLLDERTIELGTETRKILTELTEKWLKAA